MPEESLPYLEYIVALPSVYGGAPKGFAAIDMYDKAIELFDAGLGKTSAANEAMAAFGITASPTAQGFVAFASIIANVICIAVIIKRAIEMGKNPYTNDVWAGTKDYEEALKRADV